MIPSPNRESMQPFGVFYEKFTNAFPSSFNMLWYDEKCSIVRRPGLLMSLETCLCFDKFITAAQE